MSRVQLGVAVAVILALLGGLAAHHYASELAAAVQADIERLTRAQQRLSDAEALQSALRAAQAAERLSFGESVPRDGEAEALEARLRGIFTANSVVVRTLSFSKRLPVTGLAEIDIALEASTPREKVQAFLQALESQPLLLRIVSVALRSEGSVSGFESAAPAIGISLRATSLQLVNGVDHAS